MKLNLLSSLAKGSTGVLNGLGLTRILVWLCVLLLGATLLLGWLLKGSYEERGALQARYDSAVVVQADLRTQIKGLGADKKDLKASCEVTTSVQGENARIKRLSAQATTELIKQSGVILNEAVKNAAGGGSPDAVLQLLDSTTCKARNNGLPCGTGDSSPAL